MQVHRESSPVDVGNTRLSHATPPPVLSPLSHEHEVYSTPAGQPDSNDELVAIDVLSQMKNSGHSTPILEHRQLFTELPSSPHTTSETLAHNDTVDENDQYFDTSNDSESINSDSSRRSSSTRLRLYDKMRNHPIVNTAVQAYKEHKPAIKYGVEMVEQAALPVVTIYEAHKRKRRLRKANAMFPDDAKVDISSASSLSSFSLSSNKKQKLPSISEALAMGNKNWNELSINMSIESKKRMQTCLQLLMLANKQLTSKVEHLQDVIAKEQDALDKAKEKLPSASNDDDNEVYHDATEDLNDGSAAEIKQEIVGTIKKVVTFISKYAGTSLPEPQRTDVREKLLRLPTKWSTSTSSPVLSYSTNAKVLVLANESLEMVRSVMSTFDDTLNMADGWVKQKQEKQLAKQAILNNTLKKQGASSSSIAAPSGSTSLAPVPSLEPTSLDEQPLDPLEKELIEE